MNVVINGLSYELKPDTGVHREPIVDWPEHTRSQGQQQRQDRSLMSSWAPSKLTYGSGIERADMDEVRDRESYWLSSVDTRWKGKVFLPALVNVPTFTYATSAGTMSSLGFMYWDGMSRATKILVSVPPTTNVHGFREGVFDTTNNEFTYGIVMPINAGGLGTLSYLFRTAIQKGNEYFFFGVSSGPQTGIIEVNSTKTAATLSFVARATGAKITHYRVGNFHEYVGTLHIATVDVAIGQRKLYVHPILSATLERSEPFHKPFVWLNTPYLASTPDGLYVGHSVGVDLLNTTQRTFTEKLSLRANENIHGAKSMLTFDFENLMVPYAISSGQGGLTAFNTVDNVAQSVGMNLDDGVPSGHSSRIESMVSSNDFLFAGFENYEGGPSRVFAYDRFGWHFIAAVPSQMLAKQLLLSGYSSQLWMVPTGNLPPFYINYPLANPLLTATYTFAITGDLRYPIINFGMPEWKTGVYEFILEANTLGSGRQIEAFYGLNGVEPTQSLATATQSGTTIMQFGGGLGVECYSIQMMLRFSRGPDNNKTPVLITHHGPVLEYLKFPSTRNISRFIIDLEATTRVHSRPPREQITALANTMGSAILIPFHYGGVATMNVRILSMPSEEVSDDDSMVARMIHSGEVEVTVAELI